MKSTRGGKRLGSGRKRGLASIKAEEARKYVVNRITEELEPILTAQIELAKGIFYEEEDEEGIKRIYQKLPDLRAATYLTNQLIGAPKQTAEIDLKPPFSLIELSKPPNELEKERQSQS